MNYFVTTRLPNNIYDIFVNSCKKDSEKKLKKSLKILHLNKRKLTFNFIFYLLRITFLGKIFQAVITFWEFILEDQLIKQQEVMLIHLLLLK